MYVEILSERVLISSGFRWNTPQHNGRVLRSRMAFICWVCGMRSENRGEGEGGRRGRVGGIRQWADVHDAISWSPPNASSARSRTLHLNTLPGKVSDIIFAVHAEHSFVLATGPFARLRENVSPEVQQTRISGGVIHEIGINASDWQLLADHGVSNAKIS